MTDEDLKKEIEHRWFLRIGSTRYSDWLTVLGAGSLFLFEFGLGYFTVEYD